MKSAPETPRVGELNCRVLIRESSDAPNASFDVDRSYDAGTTRWAKFEAVRSLTLRAGVPTGEMPTHLVWVRASAGVYAEDLNETHVVEYGGRRYRVLDSIDLGGYTRISVKDLGKIA